MNHSAYLPPDYGTVFDHARSGSPAVAAAAIALITSLGETGNHRTPMGHFSTVNILGDETRPEARQHARSRSHLPAQLQKLLIFHNYFDL